MFKNFKILNFERSIETLLIILIFKRIRSAKEKFDIDEYNWQKINKIIQSEEMCSNYERL